MSEPDKHDDQIEVLSEQQCLDLLASQDLGRIAFTVGEQPEIFPVNYATDRAIVVFRTATGTKLEQALVSRVAFEVDEWDPQTKLGWSVVLKGIAEEVTTGIDPFSAKLRTHAVSPLAPGERERWIAIYPSEISGRRFRRT
jgi:nitroimidazol reductase NimA-like FMN-containing flavoprotein (pyridoxamine 5'-phosphate oxidase superfamily)